MNNILIGKTFIVPYTDVVVKYENIYYKDQKGFLVKDGTITVQSVYYSQFLDDVRYTSDNTPYCIKRTQECMLRVKYAPSVENFGLHNALGDAYIDIPARLIMDWNVKLTQADTIGKEIKRIDKKGRNIIVKFKDGSTKTFK